MKRYGLLVVVFSAILSGCKGVPSGVKVVEPFDVQRYQGTWYEIARLDHRFERGLTHVSATYTPRDDGGVTVNNRGYDEKHRRWKDIQGRAYFVDEATQGRLKVTFFWPFYGAYNVIVLDREAYSFAMVCGPSRKYLWILAREKTLPAAVLDGLIAEALRLGFPTEQLIYVRQDGAVVSDPEAGNHTEKGKMP